ncbi:bacteriophage Gp15 family protein [Clostridium botulinum]|uniref:bacteriophage Gp15 family protein n=1 Tax=Clostridium botulinum TaxID=1491 RepID=UPI001C9ADA68|nr:bacteriophage Gp15 family protein [Clostridium botulinum]MBY6816470.1 bacteriophage Gp15 family protein [Clostridium botulinum]MBY6827275.1 bacteriophage Gp15 family protein [Clostridium botulinum]MBY6859223.1 bacteriophage Gp15 family protein [Clostridium botulinum]MBY7041493.1 bacteriophage Gp15 family protein [Clostridium botulinum]
MSFLTGVLPTIVNINNKKYEIRSDFRTSILFSKLIENELNEDTIIEILKLYYPKFNELDENDIDIAFDNILWFYRCGEEEIEKSKGNSSNNNKIFDYEKDANYIYSAFLSQYNIDLQEIKYLHWWKFKALFDSLSDDNKIVEIMRYRAIDLFKIEDKEQKKFYKKMKDLYSLDVMSKEEKEELEKLNNEWK